MKMLTAIMLGLTLLLPVAISGAAQADSLTVREQMEKCFRMHGNLMSKPALTNVRSCWQAHGYLMDRKK